MNTFDFMSDLLKIMLAWGAYLGVLGVGILAACWMGRRPHRTAGHHE